MSTGSIVIIGAHISQVKGEIEILRRQIYRVRVWIDRDGRTGASGWGAKIELALRKPCAE